MNISNRRGEGSTGVVAIVAIVVLVLIGAYFLFFRGSNEAPADSVVIPDTVNVTVPDAMTPDRSAEPAQ